MMEGIKLSIRIKTELEKDIAYISDIDAFRSLFPDRVLHPNNEKSLNAFEIDPADSEIVIDGKRYTILYMLTKFFNITIPPPGDIGINFYGIGKDHPYNFQVTYVVAPQS